MRRTLLPGNPGMPPMMTESLLLLALIGLVLAVLSLPQPRPAATSTAPTAVCSTDADCAAWEVAHDVPEADRCHGGPCSKGGAR
jgi:hypothetical protein